MNISEIIKQRDLQEVLHFTTNNGLTGILASGHIHARPGLTEDKYLSHVLKLNSIERPEESEDFNKSQNWINFVNLSISEVNKRFFSSSRRSHSNTDFWWCILSFSPELMNNEGVWFTTTNNSYEDCVRGTGAEGLEALYADKVLRMRCDQFGKPWWAKRQGRALNLPTCEQAEVLYPKKLSLEYLTKVYVETEEHQDIITGWLEDFDFPGIKVVTDAQKFEGKIN